MKKLRHFKSSTSQSQFMNTKANNAGKKKKKNINLTQWGGEQQGISFTAD